MQRTVYVCDICGTEREVANRWRVITIGKRKGYSVLSMAPLGAVPGGDDERNEQFHLCGNECVHRKVNEYLEDETKPPKEENA